MKTTQRIGEANKEIAIRRRDGDALDHVASLVCRAERIAAGLALGRSLRLPFLSSWQRAPGFAKTSPPWATRICWLFLACSGPYRESRVVSTDPRLIGPTVPVQPAARKHRLGGAEVERARLRVVRDLHVEPDVRRGGEPGDPEDVDLVRARVPRHEANPARRRGALDPARDRHELERDVRVLQGVQGALRSLSLAGSEPARIRGVAPAPCEREHT